MNPGMGSTAVTCQEEEPRELCGLGGTREEESEDLKCAHFSGCLVRGTERRRNEGGNVWLMGKDTKKLLVLQSSYFYASEGS